MSSTTMSRSALKLMRSSIFTPCTIILPSVRLFSSTPAVSDLISKTIADDHGKILDAHKMIVNAKDADEKTRWQNQFVWQLARHSHAEELVVVCNFPTHLTFKAS